MGVAHDLPRPGRVGLSARVQAAEVLRVLPKSHLATLLRNYIYMRVYLVQVHE